MDWAAILVKEQAMANLAIIKEVCLYVANTTTVADQLLAANTLAAANISYHYLSYGDDLVGQNATLSALSTWTWGDNIVATMTFSTFPIVTWKECYDDYTLQVCCVVGSDQLANSSLLANASLIQQ